MTIPGSDETTGLGARPSEVDDPSIVRARGALWRDGDFGVVVLGTAGPEPVTLAGTGVAIWDALVRPVPRSKLVDLLAQRFVADRAQVAHDVAPVLDELLAAGVIEMAS